MNAQLQETEPAVAQRIPPAVKEYFAELINKTGGDVRSDVYHRTLYSTDASIYQIFPFGVVFPRNVEELHASVELAAKHKVPLLARAGGSSLAGQAVNQAVVLDLCRYMDGILEINKEEKTVRVQPGVVLDRLNAELAKHGLLFGPDPASSNRAAMGGIVANNSTGSHSILYGMTVEHVRSMEVFLSDGTAASFSPLSLDQAKQKAGQSGLEAGIYREMLRLAQDESSRKIIQNSTPKHWRRAGGYNLDRLVFDDIPFRETPDTRFNLSNLVCGSEGTLALMSEITLGVSPKPKMTALGIVHCNSTYEALSAVPAILETSPSAVELLDNSSIVLCRQAPEYAKMLETFIEGTPNCLLITEYYGESEAELTSKVQALAAHLKSQNVPHTTVLPAISPLQQRNVWAVRKAGLGLLMSTRGDDKAIAFIEDAAVPVNHLADYVTKVEQFCQDIGTRVSYYAHASAGCIHIRPLLNAKDAGDVGKLRDISEFSLDLLSQYDGVLSSEHGDGRSRSWLNERFFGPEMYGLFKQVKQTFDPNNLLNPGNVVDAQGIDENLRFGPTYHTQDEQEHIDFSSDHGFARAIEMCNGAAICRKVDSGTMCPSFMVTKEEEHSTRGRANLLRAALSGKLPHEEFSSKRMYEAMDLCIECKACKSECPSSVDMAKIKFEFLARYYKVHGAPLRSRVMADIARASRLSSGPQAPVINWVMRNKIFRTLLDTFFGISAKRTLPVFARVPFTTWFKKRGKKSGTRGQVVLFNDTFNTYNYPHVSIAAVEVLEACGFEVVLPGHKCCGRPLISKGFVDQARAAAQDTVEKLAPFAAQGIPIVGLEPSCLLTLRDENLVLLPESEDAKRIAQHAFTFEEFIAKLQTENQLDIDLVDGELKTLLHGHCHQKALSGTKHSHAMLGALSCSVEEVDSGCCGMAGSFGYEKEHYDVSIQMGERRLLPAVRSAEDDTVIVAAGVSCRQQIKHGTGKRALHPAELMSQRLRSE